jgi:hypothetical protein
MRPQQPATGFLRAPSDIVLTTRTLAAIGRRLATTEIHALVEALIDELDARSDDPDCEPEPHEDDGE